MISITQYQYHSMSHRSPRNGNSNHHSSSLDSLPPVPSHRPQRQTANPWRVARPAELGMDGKKNGGRPDLFHEHHWGDIITRV